MPRWLAAFFSVLLFCAGTLTSAQSVAAASLHGEAAWQQTSGESTADLLADAATEPMPSDAPLELPELFGGPRPLHGGKNAAASPITLDLAPPPPPFLERPQRPPRQPGRLG